MNTAIAITAIIAAFILGCVIVTATRNTALAKHQTCPNCGRNKKENSA